MCVFLVILYLGSLLIAAWYFNAKIQKTNTLAPESTQSEPAAAPKKLIVGIDPTLQPMEYMDNGKLIGYDVDLTNLIAKELGAEVEFKNIIFDNLFTALEQKQIDMIVSAVTIT